MFAIRVLFSLFVCLSLYVCSDERNNYTKCREVFKELGLPHATDQDCANVRYICEIVSRRAAHLVSAGAATLINKMDFDSVTIGVDGSVYRFHPNFHDLMVEKISQMIKPKVQVSVCILFCFSFFFGFGDGWLWCMNISFLFEKRHSGRNQGGMLTTDFLLFTIQIKKYCVMLHRSPRDF